MAFWFVRGLRRGIVTTRYPRKDWTERDDWATVLPSPPAFQPDRLSEALADHLVQVCPSHALMRAASTLLVDLGACTCCGRCVDEGAGAVRPSGFFELATRDRSCLVKTVPITGGPAGPGVASGPDRRPGGGRA